MSELAANAASLHRLESQEIEVSVLSNESAPEH